MSREVQVRFCEGLGVKFPWSTLHETFNELKNNGYHLEHNFGHGKENLCNLFATMNLLAFNFHTLADLMDEKYRIIHEKLKRRAGFFEEIRTLTKYVLFSSWSALFDEMLDSFKPRGSPRKKP